MAELGVRSIAIKTTSIVAENPRTRRAIDSLPCLGRMHDRANAAEAPELDSSQLPRTHRSVARAERAVPHWDETSSIATRPQWEDGGGMMRRAIVVLVVLSMIVAAGCSGSDTTASKGSATEGATLFASTCASCHSVEPDKVIVGPSLAGMATDAAGDAADEGVSTEE